MIPDNSKTGGIYLAAAGALVGLTVPLVLVAAIMGVGVSARPSPSRLEVGIARRIRHWLIPGDALRKRNPVQPTPEALARARAHFADHCATCHGNDGSGNTAIGQSLYPRVPDMRLPATQNLSDGELFWIIENGVRLTGMPGWAVAGAENESWRLVHLVRRFPTISQQEVLEMETLNPRGPEEWREREEEERFLRGEGGDGDGSRPSNDGQRGISPHTH